MVAFDNPFNMEMEDGTYLGLFTYSPVFAFMKNNKPDTRYELHYKKHIENTFFDSNLKDYL